MAIIGQTYGSGDIHRVKQMSLQVFFFGLALGLFCAPTLVVIAKILSDRLADQELGHAVFLYLACYSVSTPFAFMAAIFNAIKNATGQPEATLYRMSILLVLKLIFNSLFLALLHWGVVGAAAASFCSYIIIGIWMYFDLFRRRDEMRLDPKGFRFHKESLQSLIKLGIPAMLSSMMINLGFFLINNEIVSYGTVVFNAQTISSNLNSLTFTVPSSLSTTITTLVSIKIAAGRLKDAKKAFFQGLLLALSLGAILLVLFLAFADPLVGLYLNNPKMPLELRHEIRDLAIEALNIYTFSIIGFAVVMACQGAFIGLGRTRLPLLGGILRIWLFRYLFILVFKSSMGVFSVFYGNLFSNVMTGILFFIILMRIDWQKGLLVATPSSSASTTAENPLDEAPGIEQATAPLASEPGPAMTAAITEQAKEAVAEIEDALQAEDPDPVASEKPGSDTVDPGSSAKPGQGKD